MLVDRNPDHWKLWVFYYNPDGPLFVAKRTRWLGFTLNLARPAGAAILVLPLTIVMIGAIIDIVRWIR